MAVLQDININVFAQPSEKRLRTFLTLSQNENGRMINFRILGAPLPSNCTATFSGTKPDGNVYSTTGTVTGNFVVVAEDMQMTAVAGVWDAKLDIINGTHNIMTALIRVVVDADVVDPDAIASDSQLQGLVAEAKYYAEHARTEAYGSPLTASAKSGLTDKTRVYVYTGSESGMTAGHWYYWNGSAWADGGVYNSVAVQTDKTLAVADKAADAKITGDKISELKSEFKRFEYGASTFSNLELVETITSASDKRWNWSVNTLNGLYVLVAEMASSDYKYSIVSDGVYDAINNYTFRVIYVNNSKINFYISPSASAGHKLHIYKINEGQFLNLLAMNSAASYPLTLDVSKYYYHMRAWDKGFDNPFPYDTRVSSDVFRYSGKFKISLADTTNYKVAIQGWNLRTRDEDFDSAWQSDGYEFTVMPPCCFVIVLAKNDNSKINIEDIPSGLVKVEAVEIATDTTFSWSDIDLINAKIDAIPTAELTALSGAVDSNKIHTLRDLRNTSPIYDHLFVNDGINAIIPHESLYHLRLSKALGYRIIEANTEATSDGVIVVNHLSSSKFGSYFHHVDGVTDISNIDVRTVTWAWIVENVRYNSSIPKYRTRPPRLEEFLEECNRQNMIPFVYSGTTGAIAMADKYMGHYNYICYGGTRELCPYGIIFTWNTTNTTKEQILATCDAIGSPMIYGLGNPQSFSDAELLEIVEALHAKGYAVSTSYQDTNWAKYRGMGFDFNGSQTMINRIEDGNICNYSTIFGWDDFNLTGSPTNDNNVLTFANSGSIIPKLSEDTYPVSGYDFEIIFNGQINVESNGIGGKKTFTSDGSSPVFYSCPVLNSKPIISILVPANTTVYDLYFKATRFY